MSMETVIDIAPLERLSTTAATLRALALDTEPPAN
jgi:hypothetical protein